MDEIRAAILDGGVIQLQPTDTGWRARISGAQGVTVSGRTAGEVLLRLADIVSTPVGVSVQ